MPGQHQELPPDVRLLEEREREREQLAPIIREALEEEEREQVRITDKRGQGTRVSAPVEEVPKLTLEQQRDLERQLAEQGAAADAATAPEPALRCAAFVIVSIDHNGQMHLHHNMEEIVSLITGGIAPERPANAADLMNMANQLQVMVQGNEVSSRVLEALNTQAQAAMARAAGARIATPTPPGVAQGRRV